MQNQEILLLVLTDCFVGNLAFISNAEFAIWAAKTLSNMQKSYIYGAAMAGVLLATLSNYILGIVAANILSRVANKENANKNRSLIYTLFNNFGFYLLAASFIPIYSKFVVLFAGAVRYRFFTVVVTSTILKSLYYIYAY